MSSSSIIFVNNIKNLHKKNKRANVGTTLFVMIFWRGWRESFLQNRESPLHWWWRTQWEVPWCLQQLTACPQILLLCLWWFYQMLECQNIFWHIETCFSTDNLWQISFWDESTGLNQFYLLLQKETWTISYSYCKLSLSQTGYYVYHHQVLI